MAKSRWYTKNTEECAMAWTGAGCDLYGKDFWVSSSSWLPWWQLNSYRGILASGPKPRASMWSGKSEHAVLPQKQYCYDGGNKISKLEKFFNKMSS